MEVRGCHQALDRRGGVGETLGRRRRRAIGAAKGIHDFVARLDPHDVDFGDWRHGDADNWAVAAPLTSAAKKEARRIAAGFDVLNLTLERTGCYYIWW